MNNSTYVMRLLERDELSVVKSLAYDIWPRVYDYMISSEQISYMLSMMYNLEKLQQQWGEGVKFVLLEVEGMPQGFLSFEEKDECVFLQKLYLRPEMQGQGFGKKMLQVAIDFAVDSKKPKIELTVNRNNKSLEFYMSQGFQIKQEKDFDIGGGYFMNDYILSLAVIA
ncbi:MAG: GNAT family N-acetyltransferase [Flavobacteriales bacterium]|jgi:diamine N-acetyltransferase|nr:GNAT family N-acetyltransferase [Flavobacteriales bacterium]